MSVLDHLQCQGFMVVKRDQLCLSWTWLSKCCFGNEDQERSRGIHVSSRGSVFPSLFLSLLLPALLLLLSFLVLLFERYDENVFLQGERKDHTFRIEDGLIYKDGKEIKLIQSIRIYRYRGFLYMETSHSMFVIKDTDYTDGSRDELIEWARENGIPVRLGY